MTTRAATMREALHRIVDQIPEEELHAARRYLEFLRSRPNRLPRALAEAPYDDEPDTPEEREGADEAWDEYLRGESVSLEDVKRELGL